MLTVAAKASIFYGASRFFAPSYMLLDTYWANPCIQTGGRSLRGVIECYS